jgi:hypothetical protein
MAKFAYKDDKQKFAFEDFFGRRLCDFRKFICRLLHSPGRNRPGSGQPTSNRRTDPMHLATRWDRYSRRWLLVPERAIPRRATRCARLPPERLRARPVGTQN